MTPPYRTSGNARHWQTPAYKRTSTLGGAFETTRIICRIALVPAGLILAIVGVPVVLAIVGSGL